METLRKLVRIISPGKKSVSQQRMVGHEFQRQYERVFPEPFILAMFLVSSVYGLLSLSFLVAKRKS